MEVTSALREFAGVLGSVFLISLIFHLVELSLPAEGDQPARKRLLNLAYVPFVLASIILILQPVFNALYSRILGPTGHGLLPELTSRQSQSSFLTQRAQRFSQRTQRKAFLCVPLRLVTYLH